MDCELSLHGVGTHLLSTQLFGILIQVFQITLHVSLETCKHTRKIETDLELAISHNGTRKLCVKVLLVRHPSTKLFLP
jgi:hypothetical protein